MAVLINGADTSNNATENHLIIAYDNDWFSKAIYKGK